MGKEADGLGIGPLQVILQLKIKIITIDRNYEQAIQFDQMKIAGKLPQIFILYKPGHYDIIYSIDQSKADGFNEQSEQFGQKIILPPNYQIDNPGEPFFIYEIPTKQECPREEFKQFQIQFDIPYKSNLQNTQISNQAQLQRCAACGQEIEQQLFIQLQCHHAFCKYCLEDQIKIKTGQKIILNINEGSQKVGCMQCSKILTEEEIEKAVGKEAYENAMRQATLRQQK